LRPAAPGRRALSARPFALLLVALLVAVAVTGCGGDEDPAAEPPVTLPDLTVPQTDETPAPEPGPETTTPAPVEPAPAPEPAPETPPSTDGGTPAPAPEPPADTPENDTPPPPDSPAERFEDFCNENPGACG
jgi:outer membrane biosynthesis protein TonB